MRKSNLTYEQLIELAPKDRPFQIEVIFKAVSELPISYWAMINGKKLKTFWLEDFNWENSYKKLFTLIDEYRNMYEKPEVLEKGTEVEILESVKSIRKSLYCIRGYCSDFELNSKAIGQRYKIKSVYDNSEGVNYLLENNIVFPHYCVRPVEKEEEKEKGIPEFEDTINQLDNLVTQAQDIINKYKK